MSEPSLPLRQLLVLQGLAPKWTSTLIFIFIVGLTAAYARLRRRRPDEIPVAPSPRL